MKPQHTGATTHDLSTWSPADFETSQNLAATNPAAAIPGAPVPTAANSDEQPAPADAHRLAA